MSKKVSWPCSILQGSEMRGTPAVDAAVNFKFGNKRREFVFVSAPAAEAAGVDGLAHLRIADGANPALTFVEPRAVGVGRQIDMGQNPRQRAVEVLDPIRKPDRENRIR